jgi:hypothetical protein
MSCCVLFCPPRWTICPVGCPICPLLCSANVWFLSFICPPVDTSVTRLVTGCLHATPVRMCPARGHICPDLAAQLSDSVLDFRRCKPKIVTCCPWLSCYRPELSMTHATISPGSCRSVVHIATGERVPTSVILDQTDFGHFASRTLHAVLVEVIHGLGFCVQQLPTEP